ncbi:MAG: Lrp/AsnC family transcriptional regulator [Bosea sp. (in: a-proteobacteria)]
MAIDSHDISILRELQRDATLSVEELSARINLSRNACWRRVKLLEEAGIIKARVALVAPEKVNAGLTVLIQVRTAKHSAEWADRFRAALAALPEIVGAYRTAGEIDYILKARVPDVAAYDRLYQRLIARIEMDDVSASFVMEALKETTEVPLTYA